MLKNVTGGRLMVLYDMMRMADTDQAKYYAEPRAASNLWGLLRRPSVVSRQEAERFQGSLEAVQEAANRTREDLAENVRHLLEILGPMHASEDRLFWLRVADKDTLLGDWKRHRSDIVSHAAAWRQYLVGRYNPKEWLLIFQSAFHQGKEIHTWGLIEMLTEPLLTAMLVDTLSPLPEDGVFWLHHVVVLGFVYFSHAVSFVNTVAFGFAEVPWLTLEFFRVVASFL
ncbi:hypothetical protein PG991_000959 [Apiospora marii]|uniref:Uncharacterized protein n=1 Tax=Apiospora marii TaxID=335849 RepID=A0ABR1STF3_9PEZI